LRSLKNIKYLNLSKIANAIKLYLYYQKSLCFKRFSFNQLPPPSFISFEPTNYCNLKCPACPSGTGESTRKRGYADIKDFTNIIDQNKKHLINITLHFQGEPLLHQDLHKMIEYAHKNHIYTEFSTNAQDLYKQIDDLCNSNLDKLIISLDGLTNETYNKYRINGSVENIYKALEKISQIKRKNRPIIELQFLVFSHNEHEIIQLQNLKKKYKIDKIRLKTAQINDISQISLLPKTSKYSRYIISMDSFKIKSAQKNACKRIIFGSVITWEGNLVPCCFDKNNKYVMGNIKDDSIIDIRRNDTYTSFIKRVFSQRKEIDICTNCTEGLKHE
jgi:radical SAM protein with 4Fe4S-binding SPASM domain